MLVLQLLCLFWYVLIWRILLRSVSHVDPPNKTLNVPSFRAIFSSTLDDERSDDEDDEEPVKEKAE
jgi:hypothetical protein